MILFLPIPETMPPFSMTSAEGLPPALMIVCVVEDVIEVVILFSF